MKKVAILFAATPSVYDALPGLEVYNRARDAKTFAGGMPVVAHPPCRAWAGLKHMAKPEPGERELAVWAVGQVRRWGGVLEHPSRTALWPELGLPVPGNGIDGHHGWTLGVRQKEWGHLAEKPTLLYIVGISPREMPPLPLALHDAPMTICQSGRRRDGTRKAGREVPKTMREATPLAFAEWLIAIARTLAQPLEASAPTEVMVV